MLKDKESQESFNKINYSLHFDEKSEDHLSVDKANNNQEEAVSPYVGIEQNQILLEDNSR